MANELFLDRATLAMVTTGVGMVCWIALHLSWDKDRASGPTKSRASKSQGICPACASCHGCPQVGRDAPGEKLSLDMDLACRTIATRYRLSERECEILPYLLRGHKALSIAHTLDMSESSVRTHTRRMYGKLGVNSGDGLFRLAEAQGAVSATLARETDIAR